MIPSACLFFMLMLCGPTCFSFFTFPVAQSQQEGSAAPLQMDFTFMATDRQGNELYNDGGIITLSGNRFRMEVAEDLVMVSDGVTLWVYKPQSEDIIIMEAGVAGIPAEASAVSAVSKDNSLEQALQNMAALFGYSDSTGSKIDVKRGPDGKISQIKFISKDNSSYMVKVKSVKTLSPDAFKESYFTLQVREYPNTIVTDLR